MKVSGREIELDEGWLKNYTDWNLSVAKLLGLANDIRISDAHADILYFIREFYETYHCVPTIPKLNRHVQKIVGNFKTSSKNYRRLFPQGVDINLYKIAGIPKQVGLKANNHESC